MGVVLRLHHRRFIPTLTVFALLLLLSPSSSASSLNNFSERLGRGAGLPGRIVDQKRLSRPGSAPPRCRLRCGNCEPCQAVRVCIQQGLITPLEYYPEAWRCKCGERTFMP
ncbi:unnamed protein product [Microthlaspi erraticum]|uniref:Epidermal patterning factor-like protein n=1 Tax=Microthlaspi erraticum TaxID=1685480 RepID=A0A6D2HL22_9BRAS|nr:unnamed protein product [Microthlaspi erraticum]